jgi:hypothetical protein
VERHTGDRGKSRSKTPASSEPSVQRDRCRKSKVSRHSRHWEIIISKVEGNGTSKVSKSRQGSRPSISRGHMAEIKCHRHLAHREIGISRDKREGNPQVKNLT